MLVNILVQVMTKYVLVLHSKVKIMNTLAQMVGKYVCIWISTI